MLACQSSSCTFSSDPLLAESGVLWRALQLSEELGFDRVLIIEGDAKLVTDSVLHDEEECNTWYSYLIKNIKHFMQMKPLWILDFIRREGNVVTY